MTAPQAKSILDAWRNKLELQIWTEDICIYYIQFARFSLQQREYGILGHLTLAETVPTC